MFVTKIYRIFFKTFKAIRKVIHHPSPSLLSFFFHLDFAVLEVFFFLEVFGLAATFLFLVAEAFLLVLILPFTLFAFVSFDDVVTVVFFVFDFFCSAFQQASKSFDIDWVGRYEEQIVSRG